MFILLSVQQSTITKFTIYSSIKSDIKVESPTLKQHPTTCNQKYQDCCVLKRGHIKSTCAKS